MSKPTDAPRGGCVTVTGFGGVGFQVAPLAGRVGWYRMLHPECAAELHLTNPTEHRVTHFADIHDCDAREWWTREGLASRSQSSGPN